MKRNKTEPRFRRMTFPPVGTEQGEKVGSVLPLLKKEENMKKL